MSFLIRAALVWIALLSVAQAAEDHAAIRKALAAVIPEAAPDEIRPAALPGLFEVTYGPEVLYVSEDGRFLVQGHLIDLAARTDLTEQRQGQLRSAALAGLGEDKMVIFPAAKPRHTLTVLTDMKLVRQFRLQGTPAIVFEDGHVVPGYVPAKKLAAMLDENAR